jgi:hypothetical protein
MNVIFFQRSTLTTFETQSTVTVGRYVLSCLPPLITSYRRLYRGTQSWPFQLIVKCETIPDEEKQLRKYQPRSDLLVSKSTLPRLLVEVNSKPKRERPEDLVRMLLMGAAVVRMANKFLDRFRESKTFVLFAIYIWSDSKVSRFSLFQLLDGAKVCWTV